MKKTDNFLDYVFHRSPDLDWDEVPEAEEDDDTIAEANESAEKGRDTFTGESNPVEEGEESTDESDPAAARGTLVVLHIRHRGLTNTIAQKFFDKPEYTHVHLEPMGSFILKQIDGQKTVYEIGQRLHEAFGEEAEPLYERLSVYVKNLERNGFISKTR